MDNQESKEWTKQDFAAFAEMWQSEIAKKYYEKLVITRDYYLGVAMGAGKNEDAVHAVHIASAYDGFIKDIDATLNSARELKEQEKEETTKKAK